MADLRRLVLTAPHARSRERFLALHDIAQGTCATHVAARTGRYPQTVMGWLHGYGEHGPEALLYRRTGRRPPFARTSQPSGTKVGSEGQRKAPVRVGQCLRQVRHRQARAPSRTPQSARRLQAFAARYRRSAGTARLRDGQGTAVRTGTGKAAAGRSGLLPIIRAEYLKSLKPPRFPTFVRVPALSGSVNCSIGPPCAWS